MHFIIVCSLVPLGETKVFVVVSDERWLSVFVEKSIGQEHLASRQHLLFWVLLRLRDELSDQKSEVHIIISFPQHFVWYLILLEVFFVFYLGVASDATRPFLTLFLMA